MFGFGNKAPKIAVPASAKLGKFDVPGDLLQKLARDIQERAKDTETRGLAPGQVLGMQVNSALTGLVVSVTKQTRGLRAHPLTPSQTP